MTFDDAATAAGAKALAEAGIDAGEVGLLINTSVTRDVPRAVGRRPASTPGWPCRRRALGFDLTNACLGFVNGMTLAAQLIDSGQIRYAVIVNGEDPRPTQEATLDRLTGRSPPASSSSRSSPP